MSTEALHRDREEQQVTIEIDTSQTPLTVDHGTELAEDLIRALAPLSGDRAAVNATLGHWLDVLEAGNLSLVCTAAVQVIFAECLTPTDDLPPHQLALVSPTERNPA